MRRAARLGPADLAERVAYLASDEDLDDGDAPATLETALGFLAFFGAVESEEGKVDLGTSWNGEICADWRFPDNRIVTLWFIDHEQGRHELPPARHVARHCRPRAVREDGTLFRT